MEFVRPWRLRAAWAPVSAANLARGLRRLEQSREVGRVPIAVGVRSLEEQFRRSAALAATGPQTLLHGDAHPANTYRLPDGTTGFYDWQLVRSGNWSHDVGYFLIGSLSVEDRRVYQVDLLRFYLDQLEEAGVRPPAFDAAWARYRATPAFGLGTWLHTLAAGSLQPYPLSVEMVSRFATAYSDLLTDTSIVTAAGARRWEPSGG
jgi:aminoglycoside phosphotransferase (APT) family kinase protein